MAAYRESLVERLYGSMLNSRLGERTREPNPPYLGARGGVDRVVREAEAFTLGAAVPDTALARGLEAVFTEVERVERHGFTEPELARTTRRLLRGYERAYVERENAESGSFTDQLTSESMRRAAQMYLDPGRFVRVTLVPEAQAASS